MLKFSKETSVKTGRKFDETFKREAINNWLSCGKSAAVIATELELSPNRLVRILTLLLSSDIAVPRPAETNI